MPDVATGAWLSGAGATFALITLAEFGDKSQLVCMTLACRYRGLPVLLGAMAAFIVLNALAVLFGAAVARWLPEALLAGLVALLFGFFGLHALLAAADDEEAEVPERSSHGIFLTTFLLILVAEFGDKTQLAVAGLGGTEPPTAVWVGATLALLLTSTIGVVAGRRVLQRLPLAWLHRFSGVLFLLLAGLAGWRAASALLA